MRRINLLYLFIPLLIAGLFWIFKYLHRSTASFYGVAENQEIQINLDHPVIIQAIQVTPGQFVTKGTLLLEVSRPVLGARQLELDQDIAELQAREQLRTADIKGELHRLRAERMEKTGILQAKIRTLESEATMNRTLLRELKSIAISDSASAGMNPYSARLAALREELNLALAPLDAEIARLENELKLSGRPVQAQLGKIKSEQQFNEQEQKRLQLFAPTDGLVGSIHCKPGENISAFNTFISFYEQNPNTVVAYVHESLILEVRVGDSLEVVSSLHPTEFCQGQIIGLGHRVVEIPERLRKIPEIKTYGREILVRIPPNNQFLQKEKVVLRRLNASPNGWLSLLNGK